MNFMDDNFYSDEELYRAVLPRDMFWKENGELSSTAFKDRNGLSVDRGYYRSDSDVVFDMHMRLDGTIVKVTVADCMNINACVRYLPSRLNKYHSEIHGGKDKLMLSASQCKYLARRAIVLNYY